MNLSLPKGHKLVRVEVHSPSGVVNIAAEEFKGMNALPNGTPLILAQREGKTYEFVGFPFVVVHEETFVVLAGANEMPKGA